MTSCELRIRKMTFADLDDLYALLSDVEVMRFIEPPFSKEKTVQFLMDAGLPEIPLVYAVEDSSSFIGYVIFHDYDEENMEIGWILKRDVWEKVMQVSLQRCSLMSLENSEKAQSSNVIRDKQLQSILQRSMASYSPASGMDAMCISWRNHKRIVCMEWYLQEMRRETMSANT